MRGNLYHSLADDPIHCADVLRKSPARRLEPSSRPDLLIDRTLRVSLRTAVIALSARNVMEDHHPVSRAELLNALSDLRDRAGHLMAKYPRRRVRADGYLLKIGPTDPAGIDLHEKLSRADLRHRQALHAD